LRLEPKLGRSEIAFLKDEDSVVLSFESKSSFVGDVLRPEDSELLPPPLLCKLLLLLPEVALPIECLFLSFEFARCRS
jgi:hypothetical protein